MHDLRPYVPRLVLEWAAETPKKRYRAIEGTLVFCDVSGFTALSERLARLGKLGAEELNETLNGVFSELLARAADFGGSLLKYGGDAVLVFFWGDDHARRGAAAAAGMRKALRTAGNVQTAGGRVRLRMSVGVHTGTFDFFLVGGSHRELVVAGPAATLTSALEAEADAGEVLISRATAECLPQSCLGESKGDGVLLRRAPAAPKVDPAAADLPDGPDPGQFVPEALRRHLGAGGHEPEHRLVAAAFVAFVGLDGALARDGGDAVANGLEELLTATQRHFDEHGIAFLTTDIYGDGGKIFAATGAPRTWANNEERMLRALRGLLDEKHAFELHAGVQRGYAFAGDVGPDFRRTYTLLGDVINTAARVMASAHHGQLRVMPEVLRRSSTLFETSEQEPFAAKGKAEPLVTHAVGHVVGTRIAETSDLPLIGRDGLLAGVVNAARGALAGAGGVLQLTGPDGIGKTRLVDEALCVIGEVDVFATSADEYGQATAYAAVRPLVAGALGVADAATVDALRERIDTLAPGLAPWLPLVATLFGLDLPPTQEMARLSEHLLPERLRATVTRLLAAARPESTVWRVEDAHLMDEPSRLLVVDLAAATADRGWLVLVTAHTDAAVIAGAPSLNVGPLDTDASLTLLRTAAPGRYLPDQARHLAEQAGGNPLFLRELAAADTQDGALPDSVEAVVASRIDALDPADRARLRAAAVLGTTVDGGVLRELTGGPVQLAGGLEDFLERDGDDIRFRQAVFQHAAYAGLSYRRRRALHAAAGRAIEARLTEPADAAELLSLHFHEAHDFARSWRYSLTAARRAAEGYAPAEAVRFYRRMLDATKGVSIPETELADVLRSLALQLDKAGRPRELPDVLRRARALVTDPAALATLHLQEGRARQSVGAEGPAMRWYRRGLRIARSDAGPEARKAEVRLLSAAIATTAQADPRRATPAAQELLELARELDDSAGQAHALLILGLAALVVGDPQAEGYFTEALARYEAVPDPAGAGQTLSYLGSLVEMRGEWDLAVERFAAAAAALTEAGEVVSAAAAEHNIGEIRVHQGHPDAREHLERALDTFRAAGSAYAAYAEKYLAIVLAYAGDCDRAHELLDRASGAFGTDGIALERATVFVVEGRFAEAGALLDEHADDGARIGRAALLRAVCSAEGGRPAPAIIEQALQLAESVADYPTVLAAHAVLGHTDAVAELRDRLGIETLPPWLPTGEG